MGAPTGDPRLVRELNDFLGRELGRSADQRPIFAWKWSDDLFWPAFRDGWEQQEVPIEIPLIGTCVTTVAIENRAVPHYRRDRQVRRFDTWYMTKLLTPEQLIWGLIGKHGHPQEPIPQETLLKMWEERFPGADFPARGWRVQTDAYLPRAEGDDRNPNWRDTQYFVMCIKEQTRLNHDERLADMLLAEDEQEAAVTKVVEDGVRDCFPALLNPNPGKRGGWHSFPLWSKLARQ